MRVVLRRTLPPVGVAYPLSCTSLQRRVYDVRRYPASAALNPLLLTITLTKLGAGAPLSKAIRQPLQGHPLLYLTTYLVHMSLMKMH